MNIPPYVKSPDQENYNEELNQTLFENVGPNGFVIPTLTMNQLSVNPFVAPNGTITTVAAYMPNGTMWYISDHVPPCMVMKINSVLVQVQTAAYP